MKRVCVVTDVPFWKKSAGNEKRIAHLLLFLRSFCSLYVFYVGVSTPNDTEIVQREYGIWLGSGCSARHRCFLWIKNLVNSYLPAARSVLRRVRRAETLQTRMSTKVKDQVQKAIREHAIEIVVIEYIWLMYTVAGLNVFKILDTHDVQSDKQDSYRAFGRTYDFAISFEEEVAVVQQADVVITINRRDRALLENHVASQIIEYPYFEAVNVPEAEPVSSRYSLAFVGSSIEFNIDAISWFVRSVWDVVLSKYPDAVLNVYGSVSSYVKDKRHGVRSHGFVRNLEEVYAQNSIVINPIRMGSGLKIKCIEAIAYHKPLVTTSVGAQGIEEGEGEAFLIADTAEEVARCIEQLFEHPEQRQRLIRGTARYCEILDGQVRTAQQYLEAALGSA